MLQQLHNSKIFFDTLWSDVWATVADLGGVGLGWFDPPLFSGNIMVKISLASVAIIIL